MVADYTEDDYKRICQWLIDNSSGSYRTSAEAAHMIQHLRAKIEVLEAASSGTAQITDPAHSSGSPHPGDNGRDNWAQFLGDNIEKCLSTGNHGFFISIPQGRSLLSLIDGIN
jgi:hypothetical protein